MKLNRLKYRLPSRPPSRLIAGALAGFAILVALSCNAAIATLDPAPQPPSPPPPPPAPTVSADVAAQDGSGDGLPGTPMEVRLEDVGGTGDYRFSPSELTFSVGQRIAFALASETEFHTFTVDDLDIDVEVDAGTTATFVFTFDKPGTYQLVCIPHETNGMLGTIRVQ